MSADSKGDNDVNSNDKEGRSHLDDGVLQISGYDDHQLFFSFFFYSSLPSGIFSVF